MRLPDAWILFPSIPVTFVLYALLPTFGNGTSCNTDQNPTCAGDAILESICCTYPNICYWSDRDGTPACCPQGTDCRLEGGPAPYQVSYTPTQVTQVQQTTLYVTQLSTTTVVAASTTSNALVSSSSAIAETTFNSVTTNAVIVVTQTGAVTERVTTINGQFVTVTQAAGARRITDVGNHGGLLRVVLVIAGLLMNV